MNRKLLFVAVLGLVFLLAMVLYPHISAEKYDSNRWTNPTYKNSSSINWEQATTSKSITRECSNQEWNKYFEDYRNKILSKSETIKKLKECNQW